MYLTVSISLPKPIGNHNVSQIFLETVGEKRQQELRHCPEGQGRKKRLAKKLLRSQSIKKEKEKGCKCFKPQFPYLQNRNNIFNLCNQWEEESINANGPISMMPNLQV